MNFVEFPIVIGRAARESQPRRFRCGKGHEVAQDTPLSVQVYGHPIAPALVCPVCVVELLAELCPTVEVRPPAPPAPVPVFLVGNQVTGAPSNVVNPPLPFSEVLRRRREAQGIKAPDVAPAPATPAARPAPYTADWRCRSHDQLGDAPSEQFCPADRFVSADDGAPFLPPTVTPVGSLP